MARFKKGQEVVCINGSWVCADCGIVKPGPRFNEVVTVGVYIVGHDMTIEEYPDDGICCNGSRRYGATTYDDRGFRPLITTQELNEALKSEEITV